MRCWRRERVDVDCPTGWTAVVELGDDRRWISVGKMLDEGASRAPACSICATSTCDEGASTRSSGSCRSATRARRTQSRARRRAGLRSVDATDAASVRHDVPSSDVSDARLHRVRRVSASGCIARLARRTIYWLDASIGLARTTFTGIDDQVTATRERCNRRSDSEFPSPPSPSSTASSRPSSPTSPGSTTPWRRWSGCSAT